MGKRGSGEAEKRGSGVAGSTDYCEGGVEDFGLGVEGLGWEGKLTVCKGGVGGAGVFLVIYKH